MTREDAKAFMRKAWRETAKGSYTEEAYEMAIKALEQPTIEPQQTCEYWDSESKFCALCRPSVQPERKTGKWIHGREIAREMIGDCTTAIFYDGWTCSECGCLVEREREPLYKYCPQCGSYNGGGS